MADSLVFVGLSLTQYAGVTWATFTVEARTGGDIDRDYDTQTCDIELVSGSGTGTWGSMPFVDGVATFTGVTYDTVEPIEILAWDYANEIKTAEPLTIAVLAPPSGRVGIRTASLDRVRAQFPGRARGWAPKSEPPGSAFPSVAASTSGITSGASLVLSKPSGVAVGDLLLILAGSRVGPGNGFVTPPAGWTLINQASSPISSAMACWRIADGSEGSTETLTQTSAVSGWGFYVRVTGANASTPINVAGPDFLTAFPSFSFNVTGTTSTVAYGLAVVLLSVNAYYGFTFTSSGWVKQAEVTSGLGGGTWGTREVAAAGPSTSCNVNCGDEDYGAGFQFVIAPAAAGNTGASVPELRRALSVRRPPADGRSQLRSPLGFTAPAPGNLPVRHRTAKPCRLQPSLLRGRVVRLDSSSIDILVTPLRAPRIRTARGPVPVQQLCGRVVRLDGWSIDILVTPPRAPRIRTARGPVPVQQLGGRVLRPGLLARQTLFDCIVSLRLDLDVCAPTRYRVIARDLASGVETVLGDAEPGAMTIAGVALADGDYSLRVEVDGQYWRAARVEREWRVTVDGGEVLQPLPPVQRLAAAAAGAVVRLSWAWESAVGTAQPEDFGVWTSASLPVSTAGAPAHTAQAFGPGGYLLEVASSPTTLHVAVAARRGARIGPVSTITVSPAAAAPGAPSGSSARNREGDWANEP